MSKSVTAWCRSAKMCSCWSDEDHKPSYGAQTHSCSPESSPLFLHQSNRGSRLLPLQTRPSTWHTPFLIGNQCFLLHLWAIPLCCLVGISGRGMFAYVHCCFVRFFSVCLIVLKFAHFSVLCFFCVFSKVTHLRMSVAVHRGWCLIHNIFALSRGPTSNWHTNQHINRSTLRSQDGLFPRKLIGNLNRHFFNSAAV